MNVSNEARFSGRFEAWRPLGRGAEGSLFRVRDRWSGRLAALKVSDASRSSALIHEYALLSGLEHPAVIGSRDLVRDRETVGHLLEYVPAVDPAQLWDRGGEPAVRAALVQSLRGLLYLHRRGLVHADVTPGNVLVWPEGDRWRAKLCDFGLASRGETPSGEVRGTAGFVAPEVARGEGGGPAADLYGLALTALTWIDGEAPGTGMSAAEALRQAAAGNPVPESRRPVSPELRAFLGGLGRADPRTRTWEPARIFFEDERTWGPPPRIPGTVGLDAALQEWRSWIEGRGVGRAATLLLTGRRGSGRSTAATAVLRRLAGDGWTPFRELPLDLVRDVMESGDGDPDPVRLARTLIGRFATVDVVVLWPERASELESRLLRAFVAARDSAAEIRTCVIKTAALGGDDADSAWLGLSTRMREVVWEGPGDETLKRIHEELTGEDRELLGREFPFPRGATPLSLVLGHGARVEKGGASPEASIEEEATEEFERTSELGRDVLSLLARTARPVSAGALSRILQADSLALDSILRELAGRHLLAQQFTSEDPTTRIRDPLLARALGRVSETFFAARIAGKAAGALNANPALHPGDAGLVNALTRAGHLPSRYAASALEVALQAGGYEAVLSVWETARENGKAVPGTILEAALRAAVKLGQLDAQRRLLESLMAAAAGQKPAVLAHRKALIPVLFNLGEREAAIEACRELEARVSPGDTRGVWARLARTELEWHLQGDEMADGRYAELEPEVGTDPELFLKWALGRARLATSRRHVTEAHAHLDRARDVLGDEVCYAEPLYLFARAGALVQVGDQREAEAMISRALDLSERQGRWADYPKIALRNSDVLFGLGRVREAHRLAHAALAAATAMGADVPLRMATLSTGYLETHMGRFGSTLGRAAQLLESAGEGFRVAAHRMRLLVASRAGFPDLLSESAGVLQETGDANHGIFVDQCVGIYEAGAEAWDDARTRLEKARAGLLQSEQEDSEAMVAGYLARVEYALGEADSAGELYRYAREFQERGKNPVFTPVLVVIGAVLGEMQDRERVWEAYDALWTQGRLGEVVRWGKDMVEHVPPQRRLEVKKGVVEAATRVASSIDSRELRRSFLGYRSTVRSLECVRG